MYYKVAPDSISVSSCQYQHPSFIAVHYCSVEMKWGEPGNSTKGHYFPNVGEH